MNWAPLTQAFHLHLFTCSLPQQYFQERRSSPTSEKCFCLQLTILQNYMLLWACVKQPANSICLQGRKQLNCLSIVLQGFHYSCCVAWLSHSNSYGSGYNLPRQGSDGYWKKRSILGHTVYSPISWKIAWQSSYGWNKFFFKQRGAPDKRQR